MSTSRRNLITGCACGLGAGQLATAFQVSSQPVRPFCRFSAAAGWDDGGAQEFITRQAKRDDPSGVPEVVARIAEVLSFRVNFGIFIAEDEDNAFAAVANGRKILVVDVGFVSSLNRRARTRWAAIQVIAHEVGHHIAGFSADRQRSELNADYWSGQALMRLGSAREAATQSILAVGGEVDTATHPNKRTRARYIERGWDDAAAGRVDYGFCDGCRPTG